MEDSDPEYVKGDVVYVDVSDIYKDRGGEERNFIATIWELTPHGGVTLEVGEGNLRSVALERCSHATEAQKIEYFKNLLKYGRNP